MSFDDLPPQPSMFAAADAYAETALSRGRAALNEISTRTISYGPDYWQAIDIHAPKRPASGALPVLVYFHGGGWTHGYKEWCTFMAPAITAFPAILVSVSYRLVQQAGFDGVVADSLAALACARAHLAEMGGDPDRIFLGGHSAGGQIASLLALQPGLLERAGVPAAAIRGCAPVSGTFGKTEVVRSNPDGSSAPSLPLTPPLSIVSKVDMPFYIVWGGLENDRIRHWGAEMAKALEDAGVPVAAEEFDGEDHFTIHLNSGDPGNRWTTRLRTMMSD